MITSHVNRTVSNKLWILKNGNFLIGQLFKRKAKLKWQMKDYQAK